MHPPNSRRSAEPGKINHGVRRSGRLIGPFDVERFGGDTLGAVDEVPAEVVEILLRIDPHPHLDDGLRPRGEIDQQHLLKARRVL